MNPFITNISLRLIEEQIVSLIKNNGRSLLYIKSFYYTDKVGLWLNLEDISLMTNKLIKLLRLLKILMDLIWKDKCKILTLDNQWE